MTGSFSRLQESGHKIGIILFAFKMQFVCAIVLFVLVMSAHDLLLRQTDVTFPNTFIIPELRGRRVAFDVNGDPLTSAYTFYNYLNSNSRFSFQQVCVWACTTSVFAQSVSSPFLCCLLAFPQFFIYFNLCLVNTKRVYTSPF